MYDGVEAMCDGEYGAVLERGANSLLYQIIGAGIDIRSRFIQDQNLGATQKGTRHAEQLTLSDAQVPTALGNVGVQSTLNRQRE